MTSNTLDSCYSHVPWYSMEEWNLVYSLVYSSNIEDMKKAYRRLFVWKTKVEDLPAGVECTLGILQVRLREMELSALDQRIISHEDLQLMYSTAIIRFLNMIAELEQGQGRSQSTLYYKAQGMDIPSWIVNLRHDAAHSSVLPPLHLLKSAAEFIFTWLNDYYWKNEAEHTFDYYIQPLSSVGIYRRSVRHILSLLNIYLQLVHDTRADLTNFTPETLSELTELIPEVSEVVQSKDECVSLILSNLSTRFKNETKKNDLLMVIVEETDFLNLSPDNKFPRSELLSAWTPILNMLNKHHLLLDLMKLLVEVTTQDDDLKSKQAALWINDISRGFSKLERCLHIKLDLMKRNIGTELSVKQQFELIVKVADSTYTKLKHAIVLKGKLPHPSEFKEVLEEAMQNPSQHTLLFLDSLCFMSRIPKPPLVQLVKIYVDQSNHDTARPNSAPQMSRPNRASQVSRVFTVESLLKSKSLESESHNAPKKRRNELQGASRKGKNESQSVFLHRNGHHRGDEDVEMKDADHGSSEKTNIWTLADDLDWMHCPLGCIPGKTEDKLIDFDLLADEDTL